MNCNKASCLCFLSEPFFIDAHLIPDGTDPNDSKLYFFFRERLTDNSGNTKNIHTMVARVCPVGALCFSTIDPSSNVFAIKLLRISMSAERHRRTAEPREQVDHLPQSQDGVFRVGGGRHRDPL